MKHSVILAILFLLTFPLQAQNVGDRYADHSVLSQGKWVKISVENAGVYQLTHSVLRSMGFSNPDRVRLYGLNREILPESGLENMDDDLVELPLYRTGDKVLFYGRGQTRWSFNTVLNNTVQFTHLNNPYTLRTYYLLAETADVTPKEMEKYAYEVDENATVQTTFPEHTLLEKDEFAYLNSGRLFLYAYDFANNNSQSYSLDLPDIADDSKVYLTVQFCTAGNDASTLDVSFNDSTLGTISYKKLGNYEYGTLVGRSYTIPRSKSEERNTVRLVHKRSTGIAGHLDYIRAGYVRNLNLTNNQLLFRPLAMGDVRFQLKGGNSETVVWHVTNNNSYEEVAGTFDATTSTWTYPFSSASDWRDEELLALNPSASFPSPTVEGTVANQDLHALSNTDLVVVVPTSGKLLQQAQRLADAHTAKDSMRCVVVTAQQIYNEFSYGTPDATAIRRFMKMLYDKADVAANRPKNLLLFGDGVWDNRMVTANLRCSSADDYLLCYESEVSLSHTTSYVLEEYYTLVDDNAPSEPLRAKPRIGVGRLPVTTASEAKTVVDKIIRYINNEEVGNWKNTVAIFCDDGNNNRHMQDGDTIATHMERLYPDIRVKRIYWDTYERKKGTTGNSYPGAETDVNKQMLDGALVVNYTGHGSAYMLSHEKVMLTSNFANWSSPHLPLWVTAACDVTPFDMNVENIGEVAILNPTGAAIGFLGTARTVYSEQNLSINWRFMDRVLGRKTDGTRYTIGEALADAKVDYIENLSGSRNDINRAHFMLLGDPAIALQTPTYKIEIERINDLYAPGTPETVGAGSIVHVEGRVVDENGELASDFNGVISPIIMDNMETVVCLNNALGEGNTNGGNDGEITAHVYNDRLRTLYTCADSVRNGRFEFFFPVPIDNNYSGKTGQISLYANNNEHTIEANGQFTNFIVNGTSSVIGTDTVGPKIQMYLNSDKFTNGSTVNETPLLYALFSDESGINMTGSGVGHDITAVIDNEEALTYSLNSYFTPAVGSYKIGSVAFSIPTLSDGHHTLTLRAFDVLNNPSATTIDFYVNNGAEPQIFDLFVNSPVHEQAVFTIVNDRPQSNINLSLHVYDITGRLVWETSENNFSTSSTYTFTWNLNETDAHLPPGVYIVKAGLSSANSAEATSSRKFVVTRPR